MAGQLDRLDAGVRRTGRHDEPGRHQRRLVGRREPVVAPVKARERLGPAQLGDTGAGDGGHPCAPRRPGCRRAGRPRGRRRPARSRRGRRPPPRRRSVRTRRSCTGSRRTCRGSASPAVRARRIASSTASSSRYGVPGTTQRPSAAAADVRVGARQPAGVDISREKRERRVDLAVGQVLDVTVAENGDRDGHGGHDIRGRTPGGRASSAAHPVPVRPVPPAAERVQRRAGRLDAEVVALR